MGTWLLVAVLAQLDAGTAPSECFSAWISASRAEVFLGHSYPPKKVPPNQLVFVSSSAVRLATFGERVDRPGPCESSESIFRETPTASYRLAGRAPDRTRVKAVAFESSIGRFTLVSPRSQQGPRDPDAFAAVLERHDSFTRNLAATPDGGTPTRQAIRRVLERYDSKAVGAFEALTDPVGQKLLIAGGELRWHRGYGFVWFITLDGRPGWLFEDCVDGSGCQLVLEVQRADGGVEQVASCTDDSVECASP